MKIRTVVPLLPCLVACHAAGAPGPTPGAEGSDRPLAGWRAGSIGGSGPHASWSARPDSGAQPDGNGFWTKADARTSFGDLVVSASR